MSESAASTLSLLGLYCSSDLILRAIGRLAIGTTLLSVGFFLNAAICPHVTYMSSGGNSPLIECFQDLDLLRHLWRRLRWHCELPMTHTQLLALYKDSDAFIHALADLQ